LSLTAAQKKTALAQTLFFCVPYFVVLAEKSKLPGDRVMFAIARHGYVGVAY
jgi:hypothetical protein